MPSKATRNNRRSARKPGKRTRKNRGTSKHKDYCKVRELKDGNVVINHKGHEFRTSYFHACPMSTKTLLVIHNNCKTTGSASECPCMRFAKQEDRFLELEVKSLCHHGDHGNCRVSKRGLEKMRAIHANMVKEFGKHTMKYHRSHLTTAMRCCGGIHGVRGRYCPFLSMRGGASPESSEIDGLQRKFRNEVSEFKRNTKTNRDPAVIASGYTAVFTAAEAYLDAVKADTSMNEKQQTYRNMCLKNELMDFNATTRTMFASLKPAEREQSDATRKSVNEKLREVIGSQRSVADACDRIKEASTKGEPVAVPQQQEQKTDVPTESQPPNPEESSSTESQATEVKSQETSPVSTESQQPKPEEASSTTPMYSSWSNPTMTKAAQEATEKEVANMMKLDDASGESEALTGQAEAQSGSATSISGEQAAEAAKTGEKPPEESKEVGAQPSEEASDNCKVQNVVPGGIPCPQPGEETTHKAVLQELSPEENAGCKEKAAELLNEYNSRCKAPEPLSSGEQKESTDDGTGDVEKEAQQEGETQEGDGEEIKDAEESQAEDESQEGAEGQSNEVEGNEETQKAASTGPEEPPMAVTTSTTTTPHEGYNEIHIVVKVPQEYPQRTTGTTGTTFASAMNTLTGAQTGGIAGKHSLYKNRKITPKRHRSHQKSLLRRKTMPKHRK